MPCFLDSRCALANDNVPPTRFDPLRTDTLAELKRYFEKRRRTSDPRAVSFENEEFWRDQAAFGTLRFQQLYRRWLTDGDSVFDTVSSP